ncbi:MAG: sulfatase [Bryobacteraceae bacterium]|nr:sulfatase [Bryobacteraceae bacterium]
MRRREFLATVGVGAGALAATTAALAKDQPNVLFIAIDDLNDWVGCLGGHPDTRTPNIDRLVARGVNFTRAYCAAPVCNPSRASLMTGIRPSTHGVYENRQPMRMSTVLKDAVTLPQHFMAHGYKAIGGGKIYHGAFPDPPSWNEYYPSQTQNQPGNPKPPSKPYKGIQGNFDWGPLDSADSEMGDYKTVDWATRQLKAKHGKPLFLGVGIYKPHLEWYVPKKYFDMFPPDKITLPVVKENDLDDVPKVGKWLALRSGDHKKILDQGKYREAVQAYLACIAFADAQVGRLLDALDNSAYAKNTVVVLWSDHGWHHGQKAHWRKFALWEQATRNVFAIVAPGVTKPKSTCGRPVSLLDVYPTLIDICGLSKRMSLEGNSLMPLLKNPAAKWDKPVLTTYLKGNHSIRDERFRYIRYNDGGEELYDHSNDPNEWTNLADRQEFANIKSRLAKWLPKTDAPDSPVGKGLGVD